MAARRADWDNDTTKIFLDLCIAEKENLNFNKKGLTKQGWQNVYRSFRLQTGRAYDRKQLQNKFNTLKRTFKLWKKLKNKSGPGWDQQTGTITETAEWWADRISEDSDYAQFQNRGLAHEEELVKLFGTLDTEDGTMMCVGGVGDRTPSGGSDWNMDGLPDDNVDRSNVGRVAQRSGKEQEVDSPSKKNKSMEYYVERISESMIQRCKNETAAMTQEQKEVDELLDIIEQDGVALDSELFFIAAELFRTATRRAAFRHFKTKDQRIAWLRWTWDNANKK